MNTLTLVTALYLLYTTARAAIRGFFRSVFSMVFLAAVVLIMLMVSPLVRTQFEQSTYVTEYVERQSAAVIAANTPASDSDADLMQANSPDKIAAAILSLAMSTDSVQSAAADQIKDVIISIFAAVTTLVIALLAGVIIQFAAGRIIKRAHVSGLDHALGIPLGLFRGLVTVWLILAVIQLLAFTSPFSSWSAQIAQSPMLTWITNHNLLSAAMTGLIKNLSS